MYKSYIIDILCMNDHTVCWWGHACVNNKEIHFMTAITVTILLAILDKYNKKDHNNYVNKLFTDNNNNIVVIMVANTQCYYTMYEPQLCMYIQVFMVLSLYSNLLLVAWTLFPLVDSTLFNPLRTRGIYLLSLIKNSCCQQAIELKIRHI